MTIKKRSSLITIFLLVLIVFSCNNDEETTDTVSEKGSTQSKFNLTNDLSIIGSPFEDINQWNNTPGSPAHSGSDIYAQDWNYQDGGNSDAGKPLYAVFSGTVIYINTSHENGDNPTMNNYSYGNQVIIQSSCNPDFAIRYAHLQDVNVQTGQFVTIGSNIGSCGYSGLSGVLPNTAHLHIALYKNINEQHSNNQTVVQKLSNGDFINQSSFAAVFEFDEDINSDASCTDISQPSPNLLSPSNNSNDVTNPISFNWQNMQGDAVYRIQIAESTDNWNAETGFSLNSSLIINENTGTTNQYVWHSSDPNTDYWWSVKTFKNGISSLYSTPFKFSTTKVNETRIIELYPRSGLSYFGAIMVGSSSTKSFTVKNAGTSTLTVTSISYPYSAFSTVGKENFTVEPNQIATVTFNFSPNTPGNYDGTITVNSDATSGDNTITISNANGV